MNSQLNAVISDRPEIVYEFGKTMNDVIHTIYLYFIFKFTYTISSNISKGYLHYALLKCGIIIRQKKPECVLYVLYSSSRKVGYILRIALKLEAA